MAQEENPIDSVGGDEFRSKLEVAAEKGDTEAMNYLGYLLLSGAEGVEKDSAEGLLWILKAARAGDVKAASNLGWLYLDGNLIGKDETMAAQWIGQAADAGLPVAQSLLGDLYLEGRGVEKDSVKAESMYREAFERGLGDAGYKLYNLLAPEYEGMSPGQQVEEGLYYYFGGAPSEGVKLFYMAADRGDARAMALLGDAYTRSVGVPYDYDLSLKYYLQAAVAGNPSAQFVISELLEIFPDALHRFNEEGSYGVLDESPLYWYEKATEKGVMDAEIATKRLFGEDEVLPD